MNSDRKYGAQVEQQTREQLQNRSYIAGVVSNAYGGSAEAQQAFTDTLSQTNNIVDATGAYLDKQFNETLPNTFEAIFMPNKSKEREAQEAGWNARAEASKYETYTNGHASGGGRIGESADIDISKTANEATGDYEDYLTEQKDFESRQANEKVVKGAIDGAAGALDGTKPFSDPLTLPTGEKLSSAASGGHLLESGDTLWGLAEHSSQNGEFHSVATLALLNGLTLNEAGQVNESFIAGVDSVDIDVNLEEVTSAKTSVDKIIEQISELETNFNALLAIYQEGYNTDSLPAEMEEVTTEFTNNITTLKNDAEGYSAWLNKVQESMTYDAANAGNMVGDPTIISEITN